MSKYEQLKKKLGLKGDLKPGDLIRASQEESKEKKMTAKQKDKHEKGESKSKEKKEEKFEKMVKKTYGLNNPKYLGA